MPEQRKGLLIVSKTGPADPDGAILPIVTATMAKVSRIDSKLFLIGEATLLMTKEYVDKVKGKAFPSLREALEKAAAEDVEINLCSRYMKSYGLSKGDLAFAAKIASLAKLAELAQENNVLSF